MNNALVCSEFGGPENLRYIPFENPTPGSDEVVIRVSYAGVNFPDTLIIQGKYQFKPDLPFVPGQEVAGEIVAVGDKVVTVGVGDIVIASMTWGGFAEQVVAKESNTFSLPQGMDMKEGATILETYATVIHALKDRGALKRGETLVVLGASGGTGTAAVQLGKVLGARVVAVASSKQKQDFAKANGADEVIGYDDLKNQLKSLGGADVIFDPVGGGISEPAFRALNPGGRHLVVGFASGEVPAIPFNLPLLKSASVVGVFWGGFWRACPDENRRNVLMLLRWFSEGKLKSGITQTYKLWEGARALDDLMSRRAVGKIVLEVASDSLRE